MDEDFRLLLTQTTMKKVFKKIIIKTHGESPIVVTLIVLGKSYHIYVVYILM